MTRYDELKKENVCDLCGKEGNIEMYCGGPFTWLHPKCSELAEKAIDAYLKMMFHHPLQFFINAMKDYNSCE